MISPDEIPVIVGVPTVVVLVLALVALKIRDFRVAVKS